MKFFKNRYLLSILLCRKAGVAIEFSIVAPLLILFICAFVDISRYYITAIDVERAAFTAADLISHLKPTSSCALPSSLRPNVISYSSIQGSLQASSLIMTRFTSSALDYKLTASSVIKSGANYSLYWPQQIFGGLNTDASGNPVQTLISNGSPAPMNMLVNRNYVAVEVFVQYKPMFIKLGILDMSGMYFFQNRVIRAQFFMRPRNGDFTAAPCST